MTGAGSAATLSACPGPGRREVPGRALFATRHPETMLPFGQVASDARKLPDCGSVAIRQERGATTVCGAGPAEIVPHSHGHITTRSTGCARHPASSRDGFVPGE